MYGSHGGVFAATLLKGAHVQIEGELRTREYAQRASGEKGVPLTTSVTEIRVFHTVNLGHAGLRCVGRAQECILP
jgi:single-stranded DNA-binding protein